MINNPAKAAYAKFDVMANMMKIDSTPAEKSSTAKGLLKRLTTKDFS